MKKGFTLLFAVLVSSLVLSVGIAILDLTLKEFLLSSSGRESQYAFYAADTGVECALYWDRHYLDFASGVYPVGGKSSFGTSSLQIATSIFCGNKDVSIPLTYTYVSTVLTNTGTTVFAVPGTTPALPCTSVKVIKTTYTSTNISSTKIESRGYNTCDLNNPRRVERGIQTLQ